MLPGQTLFSLAIIDYRDNDLGDYNEVSLAFFARPRGELPSVGIPCLGTSSTSSGARSPHLHLKLPVDQAFTCEAGAGIWGFPKTVERIELEDAGGRRTCRLLMDHQHVLTVSVPRGGTRELPEQLLTTYSYVGGVLHRTRFDVRRTRHRRSPSAVPI